MKNLRFLFFLTLLTCSGLAQEYTGTAVPSINDTDNTLLKKIAKSTNATAVSGGGWSGGATASTVIVTGQQALSTSAAQVVALNALRKSVLIENHDLTITIYVGPAGVTTATGKRVLAGQSISINSTAAVFAIAASGTPAISYLSEQ